MKEARGARVVGRRGPSTVRTVASVGLVGLLLLGACSSPADVADGPGSAPPPDAAALDATPAPAPEPDPAPEAESDTQPEPDAQPEEDPTSRLDLPHLFDGPGLAEMYPEVDWPFTEDLARLDAFHVALDAAFDAGAEAGLTFLAEHSWPEGYTADALLACRHSEPTPTFADLDARGWRYRSGFAVVSPAPGFRYEPTGEYPAESGVRPYLGRLIIHTLTFGSDPYVHDDIGRMIVLPDGRATLLPTCFPFLPGGLLEHRVNDGHVGGYTPEEAVADVRLEFAFSQDERQAELCAMHAEDGPDVLDTLMVKLLPRDLERAAADVFATVLLDTVAELCADRLA